MPTTQAIAQLVVFLALLLVLAWPLGIWLARRRRGPPAALAGARDGGRARARTASPASTPARARPGKRYALAVVAFNVLGVFVVYALQRLQGVLPFNPQAHGRRQPRLGVQHRDQLRDQHQLAGLHRRVDDELPDADAGAHGAELLLRRDRHRRGLGADPRLRGTLGGHRRQLLGRPDALDALRAAADLDRLRALPRRPGVDPEPRRLQGRDDARGQRLPAAEERRRRPAAEGRQGRARDGGRQGGDADHRDGPGRLAGGDQDARHQRRRLLQRQLGASVREPDAALELRPDAVDLPDPGRAGVRASAGWSATCARAGPCSPR